jgi:hypothetical protein
LRKTAVDKTGQLALVLFETLAPEGKSVDSAPRALGFRRSNAFVRIVDLSLAGRRLIDVAYFLVAAEPEVKSEYRVDFGLFKWLLATTSDNRAHIKKLIREAQKAAIELNGPDVQNEPAQPWGSVPLMGPAYIAGGEIIFELPERLQKAIKNPEATHFLSLRYVFKSIYSKILYDRLQPYMDEGMTPWFELDPLREWLECEKKTYSLFKHFRNKVLDVAVNEIAEITGLKVVMVTQNVPGSKKIGKVRFKWDAGHQTDEQKTAFVVLRNTYDTLRQEFALNQADFDEIVRNRATYTDDLIQQAMEYTRHHVKAGVVKLRAGGYFMKALREGYLIGSLDKEIHARREAVVQASKGGQKAKEQREAAGESDFTARQKRESVQGWEAYKALTSDDQATLAQEFCKLPTSSMLARRLEIEISSLRDHLEDQRVSTSFGIFVVGRLQRAEKAARGDASGNLFNEGRKKA